MNIVRKLFVMLEQSERYRFNRCKKFFFVKRIILECIYYDYLVAAYGIGAVQEVRSVELQKRPKKLFSLLFWYRHDISADNNKRV